jgi:hypothetical protein
MKSLSLLLFGLLFRSFLLTITLLVLDVFVVHAYGLIDLGAKSRFVRGAVEVSTCAMIRAEGIRTG